MRGNLHMASVLMSLGDFVFGMESAAFNELTRSNAYEWATLATASQPTHQAIGFGSDQITLNGIVVPLFAGDLSQLEQLRTLASQKQSYTLVDGVGVVWGQFFIKSISETRTHLLSNGQPKKQKFSLTLVRDYGDSN